MTKGEVLKKYGITYMSHVIPSEEADEEFEDFVRTLAEKCGKGNRNERVHYRS